jgi:dCTP deaminase
MMLCDADIRRAIACREIILTGRPDGVLLDDVLQPASIDVHLGGSFVLFDHGTGVELDPVERGTVTLAPGDFVLAATTETLTLSAGIAARIEGKSTLGRLGLLTHVTAGFIDPGFTGQITLELSDISYAPLTLVAGQRIGQLCFFRLSRPAERPYGHPALGSHYQGQVGATMSAAHA